MINHRNRFAAAWKMLAVALLALTAGVVSAQAPARTGYPAKAITLVIPSAAGGGLDC